MRKLIGGAFVLALSALSLGAGSGVAAPKSCGSVKPKAPPFNNPVKTLTVTLEAGTITCAQADHVMTDYYFGPGEEEAGPANMIKTVYKTGWVCLQGGSGVTDKPITCTMGKNTIHAIVVT